MSTNLREFRKKLNLSQSVIASMVGLNQGMWSQIERGDKPLPAQKAVFLDITLGLPSEDFYPWLGDLKQFAVKSYISNLNKSLSDSSEEQVEQI